MSRFLCKCAFNKCIHWKWRMHSPKLGCFCFEYNHCSFQVNGQRKPKGSYQWQMLVFIHVIWFLVKYLSDRRVDFFRIEYHNAQRVLSSDNCCFSFKRFSLNQTDGTNNVLVFSFSYQIAFVNTVCSNHYLLEPKVPSHKMGLVFFSLHVANFALWTLIGSQHLCWQFITCQASEPEQVATSDLEHKRIRLMPYSFTMQTTEQVQNAFWCSHISELHCKQRPIFTC